MLTSKQRAQLRKLANPLAVTLHIGKDGVTDGVLEQLNVLLENHELVKGKVLESGMVIMIMLLIGKVMERELRTI